MSRFYSCTESFVVTIYDSPEAEAKALRYGTMAPEELQKLVAEGLEVPRGEDKWFKAGQRVHESHPVFRGESGRNRRERLFVPEDDVLEIKEGPSSVHRGPGRPRKVEVEA